MVLPEGTRETDVNRPKTLIAVGAGLVLLLGMLALGLATAPDEVAAPGSTTTTTEDEPLHQPTTTTSIDFQTFSVGDIATGERLSWREAPPMGASWPVELLEYRGTLYLFTSEGAPRPHVISGGFEVWNSKDGIQWNKVGEVSEGAVSAVTVADDQLVALGAHSEDGSPHIWTSTDGVDWTGSRLPFQVDSELPASAWVRDARWHDGHLIVVGSIVPDPQRAVMARLPPDIAEHAGRYGMGLSDGPDGPSIEIYAPLGIVGYSANMKDLGVDDETADALFRNSPSEDSYLWRSDGAGWVAIDRNNVVFEQLWTGPEGELLASGWDNSGPAIWFSTDGISWDQTEIRMVDIVESWNSWLIGVRNNRDLVRSHDGRSWESLGLEATLPQSLEWYLEQVDAGSPGIAAIATAWVPHQGAPASEPPWSFEVSGYTITVDYNTGQLTVEGSGGRSVIPMWTDDPLADVTVDFSGETLTFHDPEKDVELVTVDFDAARRAETAFYGGRDFGLRALLLNRPDGDWTILDLAEEIGSRERVIMLRLFRDRMILVTFPIPAWYGGSPPEWSIKVARIP